jgi:hypothetical protein
MVPVMQSASPELHFVVVVQAVAFVIGSDAVPVPAELSQTGELAESNDPIAIQP